jgi:hypothetical protein
VCSTERLRIGAIEQELAIVLIGAFADEEVLGGCVGVLEGMIEPAVTGWQQDARN